MRMGRRLSGGKLGCALHYMAVLPLSQKDIGPPRHVPPPANQYTGRSMPPPPYTQVSFGVFETEEDAARQYDRALILEKVRIIVWGEGMQHAPCNLGDGWEPGGC